MIKMFIRKAKEYANKGKNIKTITKSNFLKIIIIYFYN